MLELFNCRLCGGELKPETDETYRCEHCGRIFIKTAEEGYVSSLKELFNEEKLERISAARQNLWNAMHERYINSGACIDYARVLKVYLPRDYYANFAELANQDNDSVISKFLNDSVKEDMDVYADAVLDFMLKSLTAGTINAVCNYIDRAHSKTSSEYIKHINLFEKEAEKVESGIYELAITRDVFLAYSSADIDEVISLCDLLEGQGISCFFSMRNLRHGRGAADNYDTALKTAMDNCLVVVFLSSKDSRNLSCDAFKKELQYMRVRDIENAPSEYRNLSYDKLPAKYKKPRVEYLLDDYKKTAADIQNKQIFDGYEWCMTAEDVAIRVTEYLSSTPNTEEEKANLEKSYDEVKTSVDRKEKNQLDHVKKLFELGYFADADQSLNELEKEEVDELGVASAAVYYYKILSEHKTSSDDELIKMISGTGSDLKNDKNYILSRISGGGIYKTKIDRIEKAIEDINDARERSLQKKKLADEKARLKAMTAEERSRERALNKQKKKEEARIRAENAYMNKYMKILFIVSAIFLAIGIVGIALGYTLPSDAGGIILIVTAIVSAITLLLALAIPSYYKDSSAGKGLKSATPLQIGIIGSAAFVMFIGFLIFGCICTANTSVTDDYGFTYATAPTHCCIKSYEGDSEEIVIPSEFDGMQVTSIYSSVFTDHTEIVSVTIPDTVRTIGSHAFEGCSSLTTVEMCGSVKKIGTEAFLNCGNLESIDLTGVKKIRDDAFMSCDSLKDVTLADGLKRIGNEAFCGCNSIEKITIPSSVKRIGRDAFYGCKMTYAYFVDPDGWSRDYEKIQSDVLSNPSSAAILLNEGDTAWKH